jgi:hypothetical protein
MHIYIGDNCNMFRLFLDIQGIRIPIYTKDIYVSFVYIWARNRYRVLMGKPDGKRPLGRPRRRYEYNIKINVKEIGRVGADWINLAEDRNNWRVLGSTVSNLRVPCDAGNS